jgi:RNA polymerase sigma factor (TIGR02999 family)
MAPRLSLKVTPPDNIWITDDRSFPIHRFLAPCMPGDVTQLLNAIDSGDPKAAEELLPLVYEELRRLAAGKMAHERPGQTLQATALVHEAWLRLGRDADRKWPGRTYFFAAAAEAMRRILIEKARRKLTARRAGLEHREELPESRIVVQAPSEELLAVNEALADLEKEDAQVAELVKLRYFIGMTMPEAAEAMDLPLRSAERLWSFGKVFLKARMGAR